MTRMKRLLFILCWLTLLNAGQFVPINVQAQGVRWSPPERLSSEEGMASQGYMTTDQYGYVHLFWIESGFPDERQLIYYSRFDGETWSAPNDIYVAFSGLTIVYMSPFVDSSGVLHLVWTEGNTGPVYYASAPANNATSAKTWSKPLPLEIPAFWLKLVIDSKGVFHILYSDFYGEVPGVNYVRSFDQGKSWSHPIWLDPDIPPNQAPSVIQFQIDEQDGLHALWYYLDLIESGGPGTMVRYAHSLDGGETWSSPFTIDRNDEDKQELRLPYPGLAVQGETVHVIWAGDEPTHREHRYSTDSGRTWSPVTQPFGGDLIGQALGDGLAFDGRGRLHYIAQLRYPHGLYHAVWENGSWTIPSLFYLIAQGDEERVGIHAHNARLVVRAGNQLVATFTTSPSDPQAILYATQLRLSDVDPALVLPTPMVELESTATPAPVSPAQIETPTPAASIAGVADSQPPSAPPGGPANALLLGLVPSLILLLGVAVYSLFLRKH